MPKPPDEARREAALRRIETLAHWLDDRYRVPGTRYWVGLDGIVGLIPGIGDVATSTLAAYVIYEAWRLGIPATTLARMIGNLGVDTAVGIVPLVGDLLDLGFKANRRNLRLLHRHLSDQQASADAQAPAAGLSRSG